ncbi:hypothetical protein AB0C29_12330 [Actinoplanes sp. NPDC048791]|uniref:hypothetical protein n=1 Tax=Actinoplanes sp. NPDC048791 TaxID=3154623 RepID=UPI0033D6E707
MAQAKEPDGYDEELARIEASIADLKIRDMAAAKERTQIAYLTRVMRRHLQTTPAAVRRDG